MAISKLLKNTKKIQTFNFDNFVNEFDFCNKHEKKVLYKVLKEAWEWGYPPIEKRQRKKTT